MCILDLRENRCNRIVRLSMIAVIGLLATGQTAAPTRYPDLPERDVIAAMQDYEYRYDMQDVPLRDVVVSMHGRIAYAYATTGVDGRGALLQNDGRLWHVLSPAKGQFPPSIFSERGVSPRIALMAVQTGCPPLRIAAHSMTAGQQTLAKHTYVGHVPARRVRDNDGHMYSLASIAYRVCEI